MNSLKYFKCKLEIINSIFITPFLININYNCAFTLVLMASFIYRIINPTEFIGCKFQHIQMEL